MKSEIASFFNKSWPDRAETRGEAEAPWEPSNLGPWGPPGGSSPGQRPKNDVFRFNSRTRHQVAGPIRGRVEIEGLGLRFPNWYGVRLSDLRFRSYSRKTEKVRILG